MQELVARCVAHGRRSNSGAVFAAPKLVGASEVIETAVALSLLQPQETECAMRLIVPWINGTGATESEDGLGCSSECATGDGAIVMGRGIVRLCSNGGVKVGDSHVGIAACTGNDAEVVQGASVARGDVQHRQIGFFSICKPAGPMVHHRVCNELAEPASGSCDRGKFDVAAGIGVDTQGHGVNRRRRSIRTCVPAFYRLSVRAAHNMYFYRDGLRAA